MKVVLTAIGHLGRDCSIRYIENGTAAITFPVAATERYKDKAGNKCERTTWIDCTIWRKPEHIKIADYLKKGQLIEIEGRPETRGWESKDKTQIHSSLQCRVDRFLLLGGLKKDQTHEAGAGTETFTATTQEDDLPF